MEVLHADIMAMAESLVYSAIVAFLVQIPTAVTNSLAHLLFMATFIDIQNHLAHRFKTDLAPRKKAIKLLIQYDLTKLASVEEDDDEEGDAQKNKMKPSTEGVEA